MKEKVRYPEQGQGVQHNHSKITQTNAEHSSDQKYKHFFLLFHLLFPADKQSTGVKGPIRFP